MESDFAWMKDEKDTNTSRQDALRFAPATVRDFIGTAEYTMHDLEDAIGFLAVNDFVPFASILWRDAPFRALVQSKVGTENGLVDMLLGQVQPPADDALAWLQSHMESLYRSKAQELPLDILGAAALRHPSLLSTFQERLAAGPRGHKGMVCASRWYITMRSDRSMRMLSLGTLVGLTESYATVAQYPRLIITSNNGNEPMPSTTSTVTPQPEKKKKKLVIDDEDDSQEEEGKLSASTPPKDTLQPSKKKLVIDDEDDSQEEEGKPSAVTPPQDTIQPPKKKLVIDDEGDSQEEETEEEGKPSAATPPKDALQPPKKTKLLVDDDNEEEEKEKTEVPHASVDQQARKDPHDASKEKTSVAPATEVKQLPKTGKLLIEDDDEEEEKEKEKEKEKETEKEKRSPEKPKAHKEAASVSRYEKKVLENAPDSVRRILLASPGNYRLSDLMDSFAFTQRSTNQDGLLVTLWRDADVRDAFLTKTCHGDRHCLADVLLKRRLLSPEEVQGISTIMHNLILDSATRHPELRDVLPLYLNDALTRTLQTESPTPEQVESYFLRIGSPYLDQSKREAARVSAHAMDIVLTQHLFVPTAEDLKSATATAPPKAPPPPPPPPPPPAKSTASSSSAAPPKDPPPPSSASTSSSRPPVSPMTLNDAKAIRVGAVLSVVGLPGTKGLPFIVHEQTATKGGHGIRLVGVLFSPLTSTPFENARHVDPAFVSFQSKGGVVCHVMEGPFARSEWYNDMSVFNDGGDTFVRNYLPSGGGAGPSSDGRTTMDALTALLRTLSTEEMHEVAMEKMKMKIERA